LIPIPANVTVHPLFFTAVAVVIALSTFHIELKMGRHIGHVQRSGSAFARFGSGRPVLPGYPDCLQPVSRVRFNRAIACMNANQNVILKVAVVVGLVFQTKGFAGLAWRTKNLPLGRASI
jgi:hypothetical protein